MKDWLQIIANLGLIAGLILVAIQINQNSEITKADLLARGYESVLQYQTARLGETPERVFAKAALTPDELTPEEVAIIRANVVYWTDLHARESSMIQLGLWDFPAREEYLKGHAKWTYGANPVARAFWVMWASDNPHWDFVRVVNENLPPEGEYPDSERLKELIRTTSR